MNCAIFDNTWENNAINSPYAIVVWYTVVYVGK